MKKVPHILMVSSVIFFSVFNVVCSDTIALNPTQFSEAIKKQKLVSGGLKKGSFVGNKNQQINAKGFSVFIPDSAIGKICVEIESQDGRYIAEAEYQQIVNRNRKYFLVLPTLYADLLSTYCARDVAVLAYIADQCPGENHGILPIAWEAIDHSVKTLTIQLNAPGLTVRLYLEDSEKYISCKKDKESELRISFDTECELPIEKENGLIKVIIIRSRNQRQLKPIPVILCLP